MKARTFAEWKTLVAYTIMFSECDPRAKAALLCDLKRVPVEGVKDFLASLRLAKINLDRELQPSELELTLWYVNEK